MSYKIKIFCTDFRDLAFNNKSINYLIRDELINSFYPEEDDFIDRILIVYKKKINKFIVKSLEIFFTEKLTIYEFEEYLIQMYNNGFRSINNIEVDFINTENNEILYKLSFNDLISLNIDKRNKKYINNSSYAVSKLYIRS